MIELTLPLPPNRANAREHWRVTHRKKKEYYERAGLRLLGYSAATVGRGPYRLPLPRRQTLTATLYLWSKCDPDNATARLKWPIDCLVKFGWLVDDNEKWLDFTELPKQVIDRKNMRVVIRLVDTQ